MSNHNKSIILSIIISILLVAMISLVGHAYSQVMSGPSQMPNGMAGVPPQMPLGFHVPKMVEGEYVNSEYGVKIVFANGLKGMETPTSPGSTSVIMYFNGGPGGMPADPGAMTGNPGSGATATMPDLTMFTVTLIDSSKTEQMNETIAAPFNSSVTSPQDMPINNAELPKMECNPSSSHAVNLGGKNAQSSTSECSISSTNPKGTMFMKSKDYTIDLGASKSVDLRYSVMSSSTESAASEYDMNIDKFEDSVRTITFTK